MMRHATAPLEDDNRTQRRQRIRRAAFIPSAKALPNHPSVLLVDIPDAAAAQPGRRAYRLFPSRAATTPTVLDTIRLGRSAIADAFRPPSTARQDCADLGSSHGQNAIRTVEGESVGHTAELGCSKETDAVNPPFTPYD